MSYEKTTGSEPTTMEPTPTNHAAATRGAASPPATLTQWCATGLSLLVLVLSFLVDGAPPLWLRVCGLAAGILALPFMFLPILTLKRHGGVAEGESYMRTTRLVEHGLFRVVRHPQYVGFMLFNLTFVLVNGHGAVIAAATGAILAYLAYTFTEERALLDVHGEAYRAYQRRVPRINFAVGVVRLLLLRRPPG